MALSQSRGCECNPSRSTEGALKLLQKISGGRVRSFNEFLTDIDEEFLTDIDEGRASFIAKWKAVLKEIKSQKKR